jgi:hypothetical protein
LTDRTIDNKGNALMLPEYVHERLTNTPGSEIADEQVITLYRNRKRTVIPPLRFTT